MITDCFDPETEPVSTLWDHYGAPGHHTDTCLVILSNRIFAHLLETFPCARIGELQSCNGPRPIYTLTYKDKKIAFYLSMIGSALAASNCEEVAWISGATNMIMFGSCGSLSREETTGKYILPTQAYRGEGCSYYYAPPADYIAIQNSDRLAGIFQQMQIPYVQGKIWTTDSFGRETKGLVARRKAEGCIAVEMELAGVQAACDFSHLQLFNFLEAGDVLADTGYELEGLHKANHDFAKLYIALEIAFRVSKNG